MTEQLTNHVCHELVNYREASGAWTIERLECYTCFTQRWEARRPSLNGRLRAYNRNAIIKAIAKHD